MYLNSVWNESHACAYTCMHAHARVPETMKSKFFVFKLGLE